MFLPYRSPGQDLLELAAKKRYLSTNIVNQLIKAGAKLDCFDQFGYTALHYFAQNCSISNIDALIIADNNIVNIQVSNDRNENYGCTPLHLAIKNFASSYVKVRGKKSVEKLITHPKIDLEVKDSKGNTPLLTAVECFDGVFENELEIIKLMIQKGAKIDAQNNQGETAIFIATKKLENLHCTEEISFELRNTYKLIITLAENNANLNIADKNGCTPLLLAIKAGHQEIAKDLIKFMLNTKCQKPDYLENDNNKVFSQYWDIHSDTQKTPSVSSDNILLSSSHISESRVLSFPPEEINAIRRQKKCKAVSFGIFGGGLSLIGSAFAVFTLLLLTNHKFADNILDKVKNITSLDISNKVLYTALAVSIVVVLLGIWLSTASYILNKELKQSNVLNNPELNSITPTQNEGVEIYRNN